MLSKNMRRYLSFVIALVMVFALMPFQALGAEVETDDHDHENETQATAVPESTAASEATSETSDALVQVQAIIDDILVRYLGTTEMAVEDIDAIVAEMDWKTYQTARSEIRELENSDGIQQLTEAEQQVLVESNPVFIVFSGALEEKAANDNEISLYATTVTVLDGSVSLTDSATNMSVSGDVVTIKAPGGWFSQTTNTVTIYNNSGSTATLSFDYNASNYGSFSESSASGTKSALLAAGDSVTISIKGKSGLIGNLTASLTLSNFSLVAAAASSEVTFEFDSDLGSITVDGEGASPGDTADISLTGSIALTATVKGSSKFLGWIDAADGKILSEDSSYTLTGVTQDMTVKAVFANADDVYFMVGETANQTYSSEIMSIEVTSFTYYTVSATHLFDDLNTAAQAAAGFAYSKVVVPLSDVTLSAGTYTIPAGVTLLIPFDDANTLYTTSAVSISSTAAPTAYRTLTLEDGANLVINGAMSLSAQHRYTNADNPRGSSPVGKVSFVELEGDSSITVNNGGALYAYGFITGSGTVTANNGSTIYELFSIADFRGGDATSQMSDGENNVFPLSQYYVQNIQVPLTLHSGATEYAFTTVNMSSGYLASDVAFIASSDAMFTLKSGSVTKDYDGSTDRLKMELNGEVALSGILIELTNNWLVQTALAAAGLPSEINSADFVLPINGNMSITLIDGATATIAQDLALLPGAEITIEKGATVTLSSGCNVYIYDAAEWGTYCSSSNKVIVPLANVPNRTYNRSTALADQQDAKVLVKGTLDASTGYLYTTAGGASITGEEGGQVIINPGSAEVTYQGTQGKNADGDQEITYVEIPITPAKLKNQNADWVFTLTEKSSTSPNTYTYNAEEDKWKCGTSEASTHTEENILAIAPTEEACGWTEGKRCCVCGEILEAPQELPPLVPGVIYGTSVLAGDSLDLYFYFDPSALGEGADLANYEIRVVRSKEGVAGETEEFNLGDLQSLSGYRVYAREDIAAKEMTDTVSVTVYHIDGTQISTTLTESIESYAIRALKHYSSDEELRTTLVDMLNYGAAAQIKWGYNYDSTAENAAATLANAKLTTEQQGYATVTATATKYTNWTKGSDSYSLSATVTVESDLWFTFRFYPQANATPDPLASVETATYTYQDHYGRTITGTAAVNFALDSATNAVSYYYVDVPGLAIADGRQIIKCTAGDSVEVDCSVQTYIWAMTDQVTDPTDPDLGVANALMKFIVSAHAYFHRDDS